MLQVSKEEKQSHVCVVLEIWDDRILVFFTLIHAISITMIMLYNFRSF